VDAGNQRVRRIDPSGTIRTLRESTPWGMARDRLGNVYLSEGNQVVKVTVEGAVTIVAGTGEAGLSGDGGPATSARLSGARSLAVDASGTLFIEDNGNGRIRRVDPSGTITTFAGSREAYLPYGDGESTGKTIERGQFNSMVIGPDGTLFWATDVGIRQARCGVITWVRTGSAQGVVSGGLAVDANGALYIASGRTIRRIDRTGGVNSVSTVVGGGSVEDYDGQPATGAELSQAFNVALEPAGRLLFADYDRVFAVDGVAAPAATPGTVCDQLPDRAVRSWGWNGVGQLGDGTTENRDYPTPPESLFGTVAVAAGGFHTLALREDGSGNRVRVAGNAFVVVRMELASGFDVATGEGELVYTGPRRMTGADAGTSIVREVVRTGDFEAVLSWAVGLDDRVDFRVRTFENPARIAVDFRNH
jgi:hypothetical protein